MNSSYDAIYLSPHLDDVALSCGGQIFERTQRGERILVVTVTAGNAPASLSSFAQMQHRSMQLGENPVVQRRAEDAAACRILAADFHHWDVLDCIYRRHPETGEALYQSDAAIFGDVHPIETDLLADYLDQLPPHRELIAPLGVGKHVDHQLVVAAVANRTVRYYPDYPYTQRTGFVPSSEWTVELVELSAAAVDVRIAAIAAYQSQVPHLFGSDDEMIAAVRAEVKSVGGEWLLTRNR